MHIDKKLVVVVIILILLLLVIDSTSNNLEQKILKSPLNIHYSTSVIFIIIAAVTAYITGTNQIKTKKRKH